MAKNIYSESIDNIDTDTTLTAPGSITLSEAYGIENHRYVNTHGNKSNANNKSFIKILLNAKEY